MMRFTPINARFCRAVILLSFVLNPISSEVYRPWVYENNLMDFGIADSITSYLGCITLIFMSVYADKFQPKIKSILATAFGCILYELIQPHVNLGIYDPMDVLAVLLATITCLVILWINNRLHEKNDQTMS